MQILKEIPVLQKGNTVVFLCLALKDEKFGEKSRQCYLTFKTQGSSIQTFWTTEDLVLLAKELEKFKQKELVGA